MRLGPAGIALVCMAMALNVGGAAAPAAWVDDPVASGLPAQTHPSLALDAAGQPHLAWTSQDGVMYATRGALGWSSELVVPHAGLVAGGLALDASGEPRLAVTLSTGSYTTAFAYYEHSPSGWTGGIVDAQGVTGWAPSLALDAAGQPHVAYLAHNPSTNVNQVRVADRDASGWRVTPLTGWDYWDFPTLALDAHGAPHAAWGGTGTGLWYATRDPLGAWSSAQVDASPAGGAQVAFAGDEPHVLIQGLDSHGWLLVEETLTSSGWQRDSFGAYGAGDATFVLGAEGEARVAYWQPADQQGDLASWRPFLATHHADGTWDVSALDDGVPPPSALATIVESEGTSVALTPSGAPLVATAYVTQTPQPLSALGSSESFHVDLLQPATEPAERLAGTP